MPRILALPSCQCCCQISLAHRVAASSIILGPACVITEVVTTSHQRSPHVMTSASTSPLMKPIWRRAGGGQRMACSRCTCGSRRIAQFDTAAAACRPPRCHRCTERIRHECRACCAWSGPRHRYSCPLASAARYTLLQKSEWVLGYDA